MPKSKPSPKAPDFDILARHYLSLGLSKHPDVHQHVANVDDLEHMPMLRLMTLAKKMGVDPDDMIETTEQQSEDTQRYSDRFPAFNGKIEFDLTVEVFGKRVTRKARADYDYTPEWPYYDLRKKAPYEGWPGSKIQVEFLTAPEEDGDLGDPTWQEIGALDIGEVWNIIEDAIEGKCKTEDAERRRVAAAARQAEVRPRSKKHH